MHDVKKWSNNILQISCGVHIARVLKYIWPFFNAFNLPSILQQMLKNTEKDFKNVTLIEFKFDITNLKIKYVYVRKFFRKTNIFTP